MYRVAILESSEHRGPPDPRKLQTPSALPNRAVNEEEGARRPPVRWIETHTDVRFCVHLCPEGAQALGLRHHWPDAVTHVGDDLAEVAGGVFDLKPAQELAPQALRRFIGAEFV